MTTDKPSLGKAMRLQSLPQVLRMAAHYTLKFLWRLFLGFWPFLCGVGAAALLIHISEAQETFGMQPFRILDATKWEINTISVVRDSSLLAILLAANIVTILLGAVKYCFDISNGALEFFRTTSTRRKIFGVAMAVDFAVVAVAIGWILFLVSPLSVISHNNDPSHIKSLEEFLGKSSEFALAVFSLFGVVDCLLWWGTSSPSGSNDASAPAHSGVSATKKFARDSVFLIDIPAILASVFLLGFLSITPHFHYVANGLTDFGATFVPVDPFFAERQIPVEQIKAFTDAFASTVFLGIVAGAHLMQLLTSQIVFGVLSMRARAAR